MSNLPHKNELLQQLAAGLNQASKSLKHNAPLSCFVVRLVDDEPREHGLDVEHYEFSLPQFLDVLANDLYWDERGNWSDCRTLVVHVH